LIKKVPHFLCDSAYAAFEVKQGFQKNRLCPPGLAVGNNTSTKHQTLPLLEGFSFADLLLFLEISKFGNGFP
jgi:hypothetical protein